MTMERLLPCSFRLAPFLILLLVVCPLCSAQQDETNSTSPRMLRYLPALEAYRTNPENWNAFTRSSATASTVDVIANESPLMLLPTSDSNGVGFDFQSMDGKSICHMIEMNRFTMQRGPQRLNFPSSYPLESMAAVIMAMEHLNTGNGVVVPEIEGLDERCGIRFTSEFWDTVGMEDVAMGLVVDAVSQRRTPAQQQPCAFQGAFRSSVNIATALYTSLMGYPQVSTLTYQPELANRDIYSLYGSLNPISAALPFLQFITQVLGIQHMAVVYPDTGSGLSWANPLREAAARHYPDFVLELVGYTYRPDYDFNTTVQLLKETNIRYIYSVAGTVEYPQLIQEAYQQGIAGPDTGYTWITWVGIAQQFLLNKEFLPDDPMFLAAQGMLIFDSTLRSIPGVGRYDAFIEERAKLAHNPEDIAYLQSKLPKNTPENYDNTFDPSILTGIGRFTGTAATLYDATVALGLGACAANTSTLLDGPTHYQGFLNVSFVGASGLIQLDPVTGTRDATSNLYALTNMVPTPSTASGNMTYTEVKTHYYDQGQWVKLEEMVFSDGSNTPPPAIPPITVDTHSISSGLRAVGLVMGTLAILSAMGGAIWTILAREQRIVKASQPIFLLLICAGVLLMSLAIIPMSIDDNVVDDPDAACATIPWLLSLGWCVTFSALFSKTRRVNIIFHNPGFRRVKVNAIDVMIPMGVLLLLNVIVLAVWTGVAPLNWVREVTEYDVFGRPSESVGQCVTDHVWPFLIPLIVINLSALLYAMNQAYAARKISTEFAESDWIARAMSFIMVVSFVACPVLVIVEQDIAAGYFVSVALVFVVCMSVMGFIFVPKIMAGNQTGASKEAIQKTLKSMHGNSAHGRSTFQMTTVSQMSTDSEYEGALILDHPKKYDEMREELKQLRLIRKQWEKENEHRSDQFRNEDTNTNPEIAPLTEQAVGEQASTFRREEQMAGDDDSCPSSAFQPEPANFE